MAAAYGDPGEGDGVRKTEHLKCPVCLEVYKTPRSLLCLHTFCEGCIVSCVLKTRDEDTNQPSVRCPICRKVTLSPDPSKPPAEWVKKLPLNNALVPFLKSRETERRKECGSCRRRDKRNWSDMYCVECKEFQCSTCIENHKLFKLMENHAMITVEEVEKDVAYQFKIGKPEPCQEHTDEDGRYFCGDHRVSLCANCAIMNHRQCNTVKEISQLGKALRQGGKLQQVEIQMTLIQTQVGEMAKSFEENLSAIVDQAVTIPQEVKDIRTKVMAIFDQLVFDVNSECQQLKKQLTTDLDDKITAMKSLGAAITTSLSLLQTLIKHGTDSQVFVAFSQFKEQVTQYQIQTDEVLPTHTMKELKLNLHELLNALMNCKSSLAGVSTKESMEEVPLADCVIKVWPTVQINRGDNQKPPCYIATQFLSDGRLLAVDYNNELCCMLDKDFRVKGFVKLHARPLGLVVLNPTTVAIVFENDGKLQILSTVASQLVKKGTTSCSRVPRCVSLVRDTQLLIGWETGLGVIHQDGIDQFYIDKDSSGRQIKFSYNCKLIADTVTSRLYQSAWKDNAVYGMSMSGKALYKYNIASPAGLVLDRDRNVCVCSYVSGSVHQISPEGFCMRMINVGFTHPYSICTKQEGTMLTVTQCFPSNVTTAISFEPK